MRSGLTKNWPSLLQNITLAVNKTKNPAIGFLKPDEIKSPSQDILVDQVMGYPKVLSVEEFNESQEKYEENLKKLQVGAYIYADEKSSADPFYKSFHVQRGQVFTIYRIDASISKTPLYFLRDLMGDEVKGSFYRR